MSNIIVMNNPYKDDQTLEMVLNYCIGNTCAHKKCEYWGGFGIRISSAETMIEDMKYIKQYYSQMGGRQLCHYIVVIKSVAKPNKKEDNSLLKVKDDAYCNSFAGDVAKIFYNQGFQVCFFKHIDTETPHLHYVINSVNGLDGKKIANVTSLANMAYQYLKSHYRKLNWQGIRFNDGRDKYSLELY